MGCFNLTGELKEILGRFTTQIAEYAYGSAIEQNRFLFTTRPCEHLETD